MIYCLSCYLLVILVLEKHACCFDFLTMHLTRRLFLQLVIYCSSYSMIFPEAFALYLEDEDVCCVFIQFSGIIAGRNCLL